MKLFPFLLPVLVFLLCGCGQNEKKNNYGEVVRFDTDEVYFLPPVTDSLAKQTGEFLKEYGYFNNQSYSVQVIRRDRLVFRMAVKEGTEKNQAIVAEAIEMTRQLSELVFSNEPVDLDFCNSNFQTVLTIPFQIRKSEPDLNATIPS